MFDFVTAITTNLFRTFLTKRFMSIFFDEYSVKKQYMGISYFLFYIITTSVYLIFHCPPITIVANIVMIYVIALTYQSDYKKKILITFLIYAINMICDILSVFLLTNYVVGQEYNEISAYITVFLVFVCEFILERFIMKNYKEKSLPPHWHIILMIPIISIIMLFCLLMMNLNQRFLLVIESSGILFINMLIFYLYNALVDAYMKSEENLIYEKQVRNYSHQLDVMMQTEKKVRMLQHDMKHHLIELLSLTKEQNNVSEIKNYILNMKEFMENHQEYTHSGNKEIDSLLNYMLQEADKQLNKVDYRINIPTELDIRPFDLNVILGNLLDNAIYAASHSKKKELAIRLNYDTGLLFIDVCNTYEGEIEVYKEIYLTTKMDSKNHGIGLQNVKKIVEEYNGTLEITHDNSIFDVKIMLYTLK